MEVVTVKRFFCNQVSPMWPKRFFVVSFFTLLSVSGPVESRDFVSQATDIVQKSALYIGLGSSGLLVAPVVYRAALRYKEPVLRAGKKLTTWSWKNPKKALASSALLSGAVYFGTPYLGVAANLASAHTIAQSKAWTVWNKKDHDDYVKALDEQIVFAQGLLYELYVIYLATAETLNLHDVVRQLQRRTDVFKQIEAQIASRIPATQIVRRNPAGKIEGNLVSFGKISTDSFALSPIAYLKSFYQVPLWMERFNSDKPESALIEYFGNSFRGDINELFAKYLQLQGKTSSWASQINSLLETWVTNNKLQKTQDGANLQRAAEILGTLFEKTQRFINSRQYRLDALNCASFK